MSVIYLLPCHGENSVEITTAEAGRTVSCPCGKQVQVPTFREIQQLPRRQVAAKENAAAWSTQQGVLFSIGLVLVTGALGMSGWLIYQRMQLDTQEYVIEQEVIDANHEQLMALEAFGALEAWNRVLSQPLPETRPLPQSEVNRAAARVILWKLAAAGVTAVVGLCLIGASAMLKPAPKSRRKVGKRPTSKPA